MSFGEALVRQSIRMGASQEPVGLCRKIWVYGKIEATRKFEARGLLGKEEPNDLLARLRTEAKEMGETFFSFWSDGA
jgi:hypothetical protein